MLIEHCPSSRDGRRNQKLGENLLSVGISFWFNVGLEATLLFKSGLFAIGFRLQIVQTAKRKQANVKAQIDFVTPTF